jgi:hypothetical protein
MIKKEELTNPTSCINKAFDDEPIFVLRAKDPVAIQTIYYWMHQRICTGSEKYNDPKMKEAEQLAQLMHQWRRENPDKRKL